MSTDGETEFLDGYTDDELEQLEEFIAEILDRDPDAEIEWVIEFDPEDDEDMDFTYEHAGVTYH
jgi:hypothetical protein